MEGPSLVIACEELKPFCKKRISRVSGTAEEVVSGIRGGQLMRVRSWGKHLLLFFSTTQIRIHFLMFGSYRIDDPRENRDPKLTLSYGDCRIDFYSCAIKVMPRGFDKNYDWSVDLMSKQWDARQARQKIRRESAAEVCDVLMDQTIFSGLGNIMKNEILYNLKMHPEVRVEELSPARQRRLVSEAEAYAWQFYHWKKANVLKRNWQVMRQKQCPRCGRRVTKAVTGRLARWSHYCRHCQQKR